MMGPGSDRLGEFNLGYIGSPAVSTRTKFWKSGAVLGIG